MASYIYGEFDAYNFKCYCKELIDEAIMYCINRSKSRFEYWANDNGGSTDFIKSSNSTSFTVRTENAKAFIQEYGSGNYLNTSSPFFDQYNSSDYWNPSRTSKTIVGRPEGKYILPNWQTGIGEEEYISKGNMNGIAIPWATGIKASPVVDYMLADIYNKILARIDGVVIPKVQMAINSGEYFKVKKSIKV